MVLELVVVVVLLLLLPLLLLRLFISTSPVVRPEGSSRSWICVSGPTELRFRLAIPDSTLIVPPAIRLNLGRLIVPSTLAPMPLRLVTAQIVEEVRAVDAGQIGLPGAAVNIADDPGIGVGLAEQKVQRTAGIDGGSLQTSHADDLDLNVRAVGGGVVELLVIVEELPGGRARVRDDRKSASGLARNPALFQPLHHRPGSTHRAAWSA